VQKTWNNLPFIFVYYYEDMKNDEDIIKKILSGNRESFKTLIRK